MTAIVNFIPSLGLAVQGLSEEMTEKVIKGVLSTGGAMAYRLTEEQIQKALASELSQELKEKILSQGPGVYVDVYTEFTSRLSKSEMEALVAHERAHIDLGHADRITQLQKENGTSGIHVDLKMELEADAEGAKATSKKAMRMVIIKVIFGGGRVAHKYGYDKSVFGWRSRIWQPLVTLGDPTIQKRLKALR